jgi:predicted extracellular nuclease
LTGIFAENSVMKTQSNYFLFLAIMGGLCSCAIAQHKAKATHDEAIIAFYNVENLFDTIDDPRTMDEDFTPSGKLQWNTSRYNEKLSRISEVINMLPGKLPVFVGLCEIENRAVLQDLVSVPALHDSPKQGHYEVIHADSPDERGIDVAALYDASVLKEVSFRYFSIALPDPKDPNTRDLLYAKGKIDGELFHFFVNHWPSRSGGQAESEPNRMAVAQLLKSKVDSVLAVDANARLVIMGDFNDHPVDKSIKEVLGAGESVNGTLYNHMYSIHTSGNGSYFFKGEWGALDQMITSRGLMQAKGWHVSDTSAGVLRDEKILFRDKEGIARPNRSYAGDSYKGGYSDHLPVFLKLDRK